MLQVTHCTDIVTHPDELNSDTAPKKITIFQKKITFPEVEFSGVIYSLHIE